MRLVEIFVESFLFSFSEKKNWDRKTGIGSSFLCSSFLVTPIPDDEKSGKLKKKKKSTRQKDRIGESQVAPPLPSPPLLSPSLPVLFFISSSRDGEMREGGF